MALHNICGSLKQTIFSQIAEYDKLIQKKETTSMVSFKSFERANKSVQD